MTRAVLPVLLLSLTACSREAPPPAPDRYAQQVRLEIRYKRHHRAPSLILDLSATNIGTATIHELQIECVQTTLSGAHLDARKLTIAGPLAPQATVERRDFDSGFLRPSESRVRCRVEALTLVAEGSG